MEKPTIHDEAKLNRNKAIIFLKKCKEIEAKATVVEKKINEAKRLVTTIYKY